MANISDEIAAFRNAIYGEDVRSAMISLAEKINTESSSAKDASDNAFTIRGGTISSSYNLNDIIQMGSYRVSSTNRPTNYPFIDDGLVMVFEGPTFIAQMAISYKATYLRFKTSSSWQGWQVLNEWNRTLTSSDDLDDLTTLQDNGCFYFAANSLPDNLPYEDSVAGMLINNVTNNFVSQIVVKNNDSIYWRNKISSTWNEWQKLGGDIIDTDQIADGAVTDAKLAQSGGVLERVEDLEDNVFEVQSETKSESATYTVNNGFLFKNGDVNTSGGYADYRYTSKINVTEGDVISFTFGSDSSTVRVVAYTGNSAVSASGAENVATYTVPNGIDGVAVTYYKGAILGITRTYTEYTYNIKGMPELTERVATLENQASEVDLIEELVVSDEKLHNTELVAYTLNTGLMNKGGTIYTGGSYDSYRYTSKISVEAGDVITWTIAGSGHMRVAIAFNGNDAVSDSGVDNPDSYTVPNGIDGLYLSFYAGSITAIQRTREYDYITLKNQSGTNGLVYKFNISSDNYAGQEQLQDMTYYSMQFRGDVTTFNGLIIAHGYNEYMGGYVKVTPTTFEYYMGTEPTPRVSESHGLTITDYIAVRIDASFSTASFTITTNGGIYTKTGQNWDVRKGVLSVRSVGTNVLTNCVLSYNAKGWSKPIHMYGDSYFGMYSDKWTYYLKNNEMLNYNLNGYPGRASAEAIEIARTVLNNSFPKKIVWCLGMNNGDNGAINTVWKNCVDELIEICRTRNIELILATIPNVATVDNTYKNAYVRESGLRYIDFANAVGAESDSTWYDGMLSSDGVHPSAQGAIALFNQAIADVPELMQ